MCPHTSAGPNSSESLRQVLSLGGKGRFYLDLARGHDEGRPVYDCGLPLPQRREEMAAKVRYEACEGP
ncbi:hypothetical protein D3C84_1288300 [compost metagenome]